MSPFGLDRIRNGDFRRVGRASEQIDTLLRHELLRRRREVSSVAGMNRSGLGDLPQCVQPRAELMLIGESRDVIESNAVVDGEPRIKSPFVLNVKTRKIAALARVVDDRQRVAADLIPGVVDRKDANVIIAARKLVRVVEAKAGGGPPRAYRRIGLHPAAELDSEDVGGDPL